MMRIPCHFSPYVPRNRFQDSCCDCTGTKVRMIDLYFPGSSFLKQRKKYARHADKLDHSFHHVSAAIFFFIKASMLRQLHSCFICKIKSKGKRDNVLYLKIYKERLIDNNEFLAVQRELNQAFQMSLIYKESDRVTRERNKLCKVIKVSPVFSFVYTKQNIQQKQPLFWRTVNQLYQSLKKALGLIWCIIQQ